MPGELDFVAIRALRVLKLRSDPMTDEEVNQRMP